MTEGFHLEHVNLSRQRNVEEIRAFLAGFELEFEEDADFTVALRDDNGVLVGTGSCKGEVLKGIAVDENIQGAGLTSTILSALMQDMARKGVLHYFIFTRPAKAFLFAGLGFAEIARAEPYAALLESGLGSVASYCADVMREAEHLPGNRAAIVMNANPFTRGHFALIERAASENDAVIVFVVSEDRSLVPFADRMRLVREGVAGLKNVAVVSGGKYIISAATFPTYFTRQEDQVKAQTRLDIALFARQIAPRLGITARYVGEEPYCAVTEAYNEAMRDLLPPAGIDVRVISRTMAGGAPISASTVREMVRAGNMDGLAALVPETTFAYLTAPENREIIERIRTSDSRH